MKVPPLLTVAEAATAARVDPQTIRRWARDGKLRALTTAGGHYRFRPEDIAAMLEADTSASEAAS